MYGSCIVMLRDVRASVNKQISEVCRWTVVTVCAEI